MADGMETNNVSYAGAVQIGKHHLSVCLKLLGIMYRNDEERSQRQRRGTVAPNASPPLFHMNDQEPSTWPEGGADSLYLAMVMLNSALLKALHVADSFQMHCHREFPRVVSNSDFGGATVDDLGLNSGEFSADTVSGQEYRRLQAECLVLCETARSLERQRESDEARLVQLKDEIRQAREALLKKRHQASSSSSRPRTESEDAEEAELPGIGIKARRRRGGGVLVSDAELKRLTLIVQDLNRIVQDARTDAKGAEQHAEEALRHAQEARAERAELLTTLGGEQDPAKKVRQLKAEIKQFLDLEKFRELQAQHDTLEQHCRDLFLENGQLEASISEETQMARSMSMPPEAPEGVPSSGSTGSRPSFATQRTPSDVRRLDASPGSVESTSRAARTSGTARLTPQLVQPPAGGRSAASVLPKNIVPVGTPPSWGQRQRESNSPDWSESGSRSASPSTGLARATGPGELVVSSHVRAGIPQPPTTRPPGRSQPGPPMHHPTRMTWPTQEQRTGTSPQPRLGQGSALHRPYGGSGSPSRNVGLPYATAR